MFGACYFGGRFFGGRYFGEGPPEHIPGGSHCVRRRQMFVAGADRGGMFLAGAERGEIFLAGAAVGKLECENADSL